MEDKIFVDVYPKVISLTFKFVEYDVYAQTTLQQLNIWIKFDIDTLFYLLQLPYR